MTCPSTKSDSAQRRRSGASSSWRCTGTRAVTRKLGGADGFEVHLVVAERREARQRAGQSGSVSPRLRGMRSKRKRTLAGPLSFLPERSSFPVEFSERCRPCRRCQPCRLRFEAADAGASRRNGGLRQRPTDQARTCAGKGDVRSRENVSKELRVVE